MKTHKDVLISEGMIFIASFEKISLVSKVRVTSRGKHMNIITVDFLLPKEREIQKL